MHSGQWEVGSEESHSAVDGGLMRQDVPLHSMPWHRMGERVETEGIRAWARMTNLG